MSKLGRQEKFDDTNSSNKNKIGIDESGEMDIFNPKLMDAANESKETLTAHTAEIYETLNKIRGMGRDVRGKVAFIEQVIQTTPGLSLDEGKKLREDLLEGANVPLDEAIAAEE